MKIHYDIYNTEEGVCGVTPAYTRHLTACVENVTCLNCIRIKMSRAERDMAEAEHETQLWSDRQRDLDLESRGFIKVR